MKSSTKVLILLILSLLASCTHKNKDVILKENKDEILQEKFKEIWSAHYTEEFNESKILEIQVITNRNSKNKNFGCDDKEFGVTVGSKTKFGICKINVPKNHTVGEINLAENNSQSSNDYFKIIGAQSIQEAELIKSLKESNRTALIFVHGFNVDYQESILRISQIAYDLKYQGPIILFTWPAGTRDGFFQDNLINQTYENNLDNAKKSISTFKNLLINLQKNNIKANLMVHSMGHQIVIPVLQQLGKENTKKPFINELILNAPDFDAQQFTKDLKNIKRTSKHITLYCSNNDKALIASETFNNNKRLGSCTFIKGLHSINVSLVDNDNLELGHSYYASREVLNDISQTLLGIEAGKRLFIKKSDPFSSTKYFLRK